MAYFYTLEVWGIFTREIFSIKSFSIHYTRGRRPLLVFCVHILLNAFFRDTTEFLGCFCVPMLKETTPLDLLDFYGLERQDLLCFSFLFFFLSFLPVLGITQVIVFLHTLSEIFNRKLET